MRIHDAVDRFQESREGARRFHEQDIGKDVNPWHCFSDFLALVRRGEKGTIEKRYWSKVSKTALAESSGPSGGYTVPPSLSDALMRDISTGSLFRKFGATVVPMSTRQVELPMPDVSTPPAAAGIAPYFGGFNMTFTPENQTLSQQGVNFRNVVLTAWNLEGYVYASNPFLQDAVGVERWLTNLFARGAAWYQDSYFFNGNGVGQPMGVFNSNGAFSATRTSANQIAVIDAQKMVDNLLPSAYDDGAFWFAHPSTLTQITAFTGWFPNGPLMIYGLPMLITGKAQKLGNTGDLSLIAPSLYVIGDRMLIDIAFGPEEPTAWKNNQSAFRILSRVDGQPALAAPITLADATDQVSPFVILHA